MANAKKILSLAATIPPSSILIEIQNYEVAEVANVRLGWETMGKFHDNADQIAEQWITDTSRSSVVPILGMLALGRALEIAGSNERGPSSQWGLGIDLQGTALHALTMWAERHELKKTLHDLNVLRAQLKDRMSQPK